MAPELQACPQLSGCDKRCFEEQRAARGGGLGRGLGGDRKGGGGATSEDRMDWVLLTRCCCGLTLRS